MGGNNYGSNPLHEVVGVPEEAGVPSGERVDVMIYIL